MSSRRSRIRQTDLVFRIWGGARPGAGRKPTELRTRVLHRARPAHDARHPIHVTVRLRKELPTLRQSAVRRAIERALALGSGRSGFRLVHFSLQSNPGAQSPLGPTRLRVLRSLPRPPVAHAARGADGARLCAAERAASRSGARGDGSVLVGTLVRRMEPAARHRDRKPRSAPEDMAPPNRLAEARLHRDRGVSGPDSRSRGDSPAAARDLGRPRRACFDPSTSRRRIESAGANTVEGFRGEAREA